MPPRTRPVIKLKLVGPVGPTGGGHASGEVGMGLRVVPLVVATALFMENLDSTVLATALPTVAQDLGTDPIQLKLALTSYVLAIAVFVPASGWVADRLGARRVFVAALLLFTLASFLCGLAGSLGELVLWRIVQGAGASLMSPVGRLVVLRAVPKSEYVAALAWFTVPALIGPLVGPPLGGFVVTVASWHWVFWINVPVGLIGAALAWHVVPDIRESEPVPFDAVGFGLLATGLALLVTAATLIGVGLLGGGANVALGIGGLAVLGLYVRHARRSPQPILDLRLLQLPTFRAAMLGGTLFRIGVGALPFLTPLLLQLGFGYDPLASGLVTFAIGVGAITMKFLARPILGAVGFRRTLIWNGLVVGALGAAPALFEADTPWVILASVLFVSGLMRSLQFTAINALIFADVDGPRMGNATSFNAVGQQVSISLGVSLAAVALDLSRSWHARTDLAAVDFAGAFCVVAALVAAASAAYRPLAADAGADLAGRPGAKSDG